MGDSITTAGLTRVLATEHRVLMLGGLAVISHGHPRPTFDADIWLDPMLALNEWAEVVSRLAGMAPGLRLVSVDSMRGVSCDGVADVISRERMIRLTGASQPLDIFREPNELEMTEFDEVWERGQPLDDGTRLPDAVDLLMSKQDTGRDKDVQDIAFLEAKIEREYLEKLPHADEAAALRMLGRFLTPRVAEAAVRHGSEAVGGLALTFLRELAEDGNPFAAEALRSLG